MLTDTALSAIWLTVRLATVTTLLLFLVGTPIAWWLARTRSWFKAPVGAMVALPLVLPPTVIGFYLLVVMGPQGPIGQMTQAMGFGVLPFTFWGLVVGSVLYSMPFVVQPLQNAFDAIGDRPLEVAATLRAGAHHATFLIAGSARRFALIRPTNPSASLRFLSPPFSVGFPRVGRSPT